MIHKWLRLLIIFLSPITTIFLVSCNSYSNWKLQYISLVYDGDTVYSNKSYRLIGIDTPEIGYKNKQTSGIERYYAIKAKEYISNLLLNKEAYFLNKNVDTYGRMVARIKINDYDVSLNMVNQGLARVGYISCNPKNPFYYDDNSFIKNLITNETNARINKKGIWNNEDLMKQIFPKSNITKPERC